MLCASCDADMKSGSPAFFCALNDEAKEVLIAIRGTASPEDVFMDVLATGIVLLVVMRLDTLFTLDLNAGFWS